MCKGSKHILHCCIGSLTMVFFLPLYPSNGCKTSNIKGKCRCTLPHSRGNIRRECSIKPYTCRQTNKKQILRKEIIDHIMRLVVGILMPGRMIYNALDYYTKGVIIFKFGVVQFRIYSCGNKVLLY